MDKPVIVGIGEVLWDMLPSGKQLGGAPANFTYHAGCLGAEAYVVSALGEDELGKDALQLFKSKLLSSQYVARDARYVTGKVTVELQGQGIPQYVIEENVAWDHIPFQAAYESLAARTNAVCFGSLAQRSPESRETIQRFLALAPPTCLKIFDINLRQHFYSLEVIEQSLTVANALKVNEEELANLATLFQLSTNDKEIISSIFQKFDLQLLAVTSGETGSTLHTLNEHSFLPTPKVEVADTIGAGDSFTAAMVMGWLKNLPLKEIHQQAVALSGFVCTQHGAMPDYAGFNPANRNAEI